MGDELDGVQAHFSTVDYWTPPFQKARTARKSLISTGREPPVCTGFPTGTAPPVLSARALSTGQLARY